MSVNDYSKFHDCRLVNTFHRSPFKGRTTFVRTTKFTKDSIELCVRYKYNIIYNFYTFKVI